MITTEESNTCFKQLSPVQFQTSFQYFQIRDHHKKICSIHLQLFFLRSCVIVISLLLINQLVVVNMISLGPYLIIHLNYYSSALSGSTFWEKFMFIIF